MINKFTSLGLTSLGLLLLGISSTAFASTPTGGIDSLALQRIRNSYTNTASDKALRNAMAAVSIDKIAKNVDAANSFDTNFSDKVPSKGITDQQRSGRCWLFTGLNVLRSQMMSKKNLDKLELSQKLQFLL